MNRNLDKKYPINSEILKEKKKKSTKITSSPPTDEWGRTKRPKSSDSGNDWREQI
jgi:hypothetical protein